MIKIRITPPCVVAHDGRGGIPFSGLKLQGRSGDEVKDAGEQVANFLLQHTDSARMTEALARAIYVHWNCDGLPVSSFKFPTIDNENE